MLSVLCIWRRYIWQCIVQLYVVKILMAKLVVVHIFSISDSICIFRKVLMTTLLVFCATAIAYIFEEYFFNNAICILQLRLNMYLRKISMTTLLVFCHRDRSVHYWKSDCHTKLRNRPSHLYLSFSHNTKHRKNCEYCPGHSLTISH